MPRLLSRSCGCVSKKVWLAAPAGASVSAEKALVVRAPSQNCPMASLPTSVQLVPDTNPVIWLDIQRTGAGCQGTLASLGNTPSLGQAKTQHSARTH